MHQIINEVLQVYRERGNQRYGTEAVTQLEHALQTAALAIDEQADTSLIAAALLHDIGHIRISNHDQLGGHGLDDKHEHTSYQWLLHHFGKAVADPIRLHVVAKRYLCSQNPDYEKTLSPTSHASFLDQGGHMNGDELAAFEAEEFWKQALELRRWDDAAKDPTKQTPPLDESISYVKEALLAAGT